MTSKAQQRLEQRRCRIDDELTSLAEEQEVIEELVARLQRRLAAADRRWHELLAERDRLDEVQWTSHAAPTTPRAPLIPARPTRIVATTELVREPWGILDEANVVPLLVDPSQTLRLRVHQRRPAGRRIPRETGAPSWAPTSSTMPIWGREATPG